jgi:hypothetical protein
MFFLALADGAIKNGKATSTKKVALRASFGLTQEFSKPLR